MRSTVYITDPTIGTRHTLTPGPGSRCTGHTKFRLYKWPTSPRSPTRVDAGGLRATHHRHPGAAHSVRHLTQAKKQHQRCATTAPQDQHGSAEAGREDSTRLENNVKAIAKSNDKHVQSK